jgi:hypothetical protein
MHGEDDEDQSDSSMLTVGLRGGGTAGRTATARSARRRASARPSLAQVGWVKRQPARTVPASRRPSLSLTVPCLPLPRTLKAGGASRRRAEARDAADKWPAALLEHPAVCEDPAVLLRLLDAGRALGDAAAAAAAGRLRLTLGGRGEYACDPPDLEERKQMWRSEVDPSTGSDIEEQGRDLCRTQAAFVERRASLLGELTVGDDKHWNPEFEYPQYVDEDEDERPIERVLAPALQRAAAAGRLAGLRALEAPGFGLEGGLLGALAMCPALTRLSLGTLDRSGRCLHIGDGRPSVDELRAIGGQLAALRGLRELGLGFGCERAAAPALTALSALARLTRLQLSLVGLPHSDPHNGKERVALTRKWSGLHTGPRPSWT